MKTQFDYSISLRVTHPVWTARRIMAAINQSAEFSWSVGDQRVTPKGTSLGTRDGSYCSFDLASGKDGQVAEALRQAVHALAGREPELLALRATGGVISFYIFWYPNGDTGEVLDIDLLAAMVALGIELHLNVLDLSGVTPN